MRTRRRASLDRRVAGGRGEIGVADRIDRRLENRLRGGDGGDRGQNALGTFQAGKARLFGRRFDNQLIDDRLAVHSGCTQHHPYAVIGWHGHDLGGKEYLRKQGHDHGNERPEPQV